MVDQQGVNSAMLSMKQLDDMKVARVKDVLSIVSKLCVSAGRKESDAIINRVGEDLEQLLIIGQEIGRREKSK